MLLPILFCCGIFRLGLSQWHSVVKVNDNEASGEDEPCSYTVVIPAYELKTNCKANQDIQTQLKKINTVIKALDEENKILKKKIEKLEKQKRQYKVAIDLVKKIEKETQSWRDIIYWPNSVPPQATEPRDVYYDVSKNNQNYHKDCWDVYDKGSRLKGVYELKPTEDAVPFLAYCENGWTVVQRRLNGTVDFFRSWDDYSMGFGDLSGEYYLGNENIHYLTYHGSPQVLRVEALGWNNKLYFANYDNFSVSDEADEYTLHIGHMTAGNYKNPLGPLNGQKFSTFDRDNDKWIADNCAQYYSGAFWLGNCGFDLHRRWCKGGGCMSWADKSVRKSKMMVRPAGTNLD